MSQGTVAPNLLSYSVLVKPETGSLPASGVFIRTQFATFIITAHHVLAAQILAAQKKGFTTDLVLLTSPPSDPTDSGRYEITISVKALYGSENIKEDAEHDLVMIRIERNARGKFRRLEGVTLKQDVKSGPAIVESSAMKSMDELVVGEKFYLPGYGTVKALQHSQQFAIEYPEIKIGTFLIAERKSGLLYSSYLSELGDSGAPVFTIREETERRQPYLVGIHTSTGKKCLIKVIMDQCGRAVAMDYVLRLMKEFSE